MTLDKILPFTKKTLQQILTEDSIAIDCTIGNGNDALFILKQIPNGYLYGFDVQEMAINNTKELLDKNNISNNYQLILDSHANIYQYLKDEHRGNITASIFNLGYLPRSDKSITTKSESTIKAINSCLCNTKQNGLCIVVVYPGHDEGKIESNDVLNYVKTLDQQQYAVLKYEFINQDNYPPYILMIEKK